MGTSTKVLSLFLLLPVLLPGLFMWRVFWQHKVPFPGDLLVGAYYPWQENIPVKNPLISDSFSQIFSWKHIIAESYKARQIPLWNKFSLSGYPLLANFHSGALYPFNLLLLGDFVSGWDLLLYLQLTGCMIGMYFLLRVFGYHRWPSMVAALSYAFSGFALVYWQVAYAGHVMIWLPFALLCVERKQDLWRWPVFLFLAVTAGHFQGVVYLITLSSAFYIFKYPSVVKTLKWAGIVIVGLLLSSVQILPTLEQSKYSVRFAEGYIQNLNFGLLSASHLITALVPDFFGNPTTYNYWDSVNYQETIIYIGLLGLVAVIWSIANVSNLHRRQKFFVSVAVATLLLGFDTPVGKLVYWLHLPAISTSSAARIFMIFTLAGSELLADFLQRFKSLSLRDLVKIGLGLVIVLATGLVFSDWRSHSQVALRNLIYPAALLVMVSIIFYFRRSKYSWMLLAVLVTVDLFRFGWKYNPFVDKQLVFPSTAEIRYLQSQPGTFRVASEEGPVMPANTWEMYNLLSPSGYDPVSLMPYTLAYQKFLNGSSNPTASRYTQLSSYQSGPLADYGVKYLLVRNEFLKTNPRNWKIAFSTERMTILENSDFRGLAYFSSGAPTQKVIVTSWGGQKMAIKTSSDVEDRLILASNNYPGWQAYINNRPVQIITSEKNFQSLVVPAGENDIRLEYFSKSFAWGLGLSILGVLVVASRRFLVY